MKKLCYPLYFTLLAVLYINPVSLHARTQSFPGFKIFNKGVLIDYTDAGKSDTSLLFVHGWCMNKTYWTNQSAYFSKRYRVVTIDLPGFGHSGKNRSSWTPQVYATDIIAVIRQLNLHHIILIGHSTSGAVILETALRIPEQIAGLIGVDNFKDIGQTESPEAEKDEENFYAAARLNFKPIALAYANESLFSVSTPMVIRKKVHLDIAHSDSLIALSCLEQSNKYPYSSKLASLKIILYLINTDLSATDTAGLENENTAFKLFTIHGTGHYPMIEKPDQFNVCMEEAMAMIVHDKIVGIGKKNLPR